MRLYISGPIHYKYRFNHTELLEHEKLISKLGHTTTSIASIAEDALVSPWDFNNLASSSDDPWAISHDLQAWFLRRHAPRLAACEGIVLLKDWQYDLNCQLELLLAQVFGLNVFRYTAQKRLHPYDAIGNVSMIQDYLDWPEWI
jgi:hypothetical protein